MNIYWCEEKGKDGGLYVIAPTRGQAKQLYSDYIECQYIDVRTNIIRRGVNEVYSYVLDDFSDSTLKKYGLEYLEVEE